MKTYKIWMKNKKELDKLESILWDLKIEYDARTSIESTIWSPKGDEDNTVWAKKGFYVTVKTFEKGGKNNDKK